MFDIRKTAIEAIAENLAENLTEALPDDMAKEVAGRVVHKLKPRRARTIQGSTRAETEKLPRLFLDALRKCADSNGHAAFKDVLNLMAVLGRIDRKYLVRWFEKWDRGHEYITGRRQKVAGGTTIILQLPTQEKD